MDRIYFFAPTGLALPNHKTGWAGLLRGQHSDKVVRCDRGMNPIQEENRCLTVTDMGHTANTIKAVTHRVTDHQQGLTHSSPHA